MSSYYTQISNDLTIDRPAETMGGRRTLLAGRTVARAPGSSRQWVHRRQEDLFRRPTVCPAMRRRRKAQNLRPSESRERLESEVGTRLI